MAVKPETRRQRRIRAALVREVGGIWFKIHVSEYQNAGIPDILGFVQGLGFAFEVKEPDGDISEIQLQVARDIRRYGKIPVKTVVTAEEAISCVKAQLHAFGLSAKGRDPRPPAKKLLSDYADGLWQDPDLLKHHRKKAPKGTGLSGGRRVPKDT